MNIKNFKGGLLVSVFAGLIISAGILLPWIDSLAKTTVTQGEDDCSFKVKVEIAFAFIGAGAQGKADDLLAKWTQQMKDTWNGPNGHQTFGDCGCKVTFEFDVKKLENGKDCRQAPAGYHCINVVDTPLNQRGNRADAHEVPPNGNTNGFGEWSTSATALDAAHELGHLMGLKDEYRYKDTNGDGVGDTYENTNVQVDADGKPKDPQSIMAQTWGTTAVLQSHVDEIMNDAGKTCPGKCCCGNGKVDDNKTVTEQCDYKANPNGCKGEDETCTEECKCVAPPKEPMCGDGIIDEPEECDDGAEPTGCSDNKECVQCKCQDKPQPPAPPETPTPEAPADDGDGTTTGTDGGETTETGGGGETTGADEGGTTETDGGATTGTEGGETTGTDGGQDEEEPPAAAPVCGDGACDTDESCASCPNDCGQCPPECGNGLCEAGETCGNCLTDCACAASEVCVADMCVLPECFGDDQCNDGSVCTVDMCRYPGEGGAYCSYETIEVCSSGDGCCPGGCTVSVDLDCPDLCGDGLCSGNENCENCSGDCGTCGPACGDGVCEGGETCETCDADCGACYVPACDDGYDNDGDQLIDFPMDPGCTFPEDDDEFNEPEPPGAECGDGICDIEFGENPMSCEIDCPPGPMDQ